MEYQAQLCTHHAVREDKAEISLDPPRRPRIGQNHHGYQHGIAPGVYQGDNPYRL